MFCQNTKCYSKHYCRTRHILSLNFQCRFSYFIHYKIFIHWKASILTEIMTKFWAVEKLMVEIETVMAHATIIDGIWVTDWQSNNIMPMDPYRMNVRPSLYWWDDWRHVKSLVRLTDRVRRIPSNCEQFSLQ